MDKGDYMSVQLRTLVCLAMSGGPKRKVFFYSVIISVSTGSIWEWTRHCKDNDKVKVLQLASRFCPM